MADKTISQFADLPVPPEDVVLLLQKADGTTMKSTLRNLLKQLDISEFPQDTDLVLDDARILFRTGAGFTHQAVLTDLLRKAIFAEIGEAAGGAVEALLSVSTTSMPLAVADNVALTVEPNKSYRPGHPIFAAVPSDPSRKRLDGFVVDYGVDSGLMHVDWTRRTGTGTFANWIVCAVGTPGVDGNKIHSGPGTPNNALGVDGDYYVDKLNSALHGPKSGPVWDAGTPFASGPQGIPGPPGPVGPPDTVAQDQLAAHKIDHLIGIADLGL